MLLLLTAACVPVTPAPQAVPSPSATASTLPVAMPPPSAAAEACPRPTDALQRLLDPVHGYCLTYPAEYKVEKPNPSSTLLVIGGLLNAGDPRAHITVSEAPGMTLEEAAARVESENAGFDLRRTAAVVGGQPAVVFDGLPGQDINRRVLFVHDGLFYELYFAPADSAMVDVYGRLETLYAQILGSFTFIPRSLPAVDDCLSPGVQTRLFTDAGRGFCLIYPAGFSAADGPDGAVVLAADPLAQANQSRVRIVVKDAAGSTAESLASALMAEAAKAAPGQSVDRPFGLTIGYEPAELLDGMPGPDISRHVLAVHAGKLYHLIFTPADPRDGGAYAQMQALYDLVVRSFRFLPSSK